MARIHCKQCILDHLTYILRIGIKCFSKYPYKSQMYSDVFYIILSHPFPLCFMLTYFSYKNASFNSPKWFYNPQFKKHYLIVFLEWFLNSEKAFARKSLFRTSTIPVRVWSIHSLTWMWIKVKEKNPKVWANLATGHSRHRAQVHNTFRGPQKCFNFLKSEEKINIIQPVLHMSLYQHIIFCNTYKL